MVNSKKYTILSLFSGCGGMDLGFLGGFKFLDTHYRKLPFEIIYATEISKPAVRTYTHNFQHNPVLSDIANLKEQELPKNVDLIIAGLPLVQTKTLLGDREPNNETFPLYQHMKKIIKTVKPKMFITETPETAARKENILTLLETDFGEDYDFEYKVLKAVEYGIPQTRVRAVIIGKQNSLPGIIVFPSPTVKIDRKTKKPKYVTTKDAIDDLWELLDHPEAPSNHTSKDYSKAKFQVGKTFQGNSKEQPDKPAHTVRAEAHGNQYAHYNSMSSNLRSEDRATWRRLTVRECARLQSFPDNFEFPVSQTEAHREIGNAFPPVLAWHIAQQVAKTLKLISFNEKHKQNGHIKGEK